MVTLGNEFHSTHQRVRELSQAADVVTNDGLYWPVSAPEQGEVQKSKMVTRGTQRVAAPASAGGFDQNDELLWPRSGPRKLNASYMSQMRMSFSLEL